jgi:uncharacterized protein
MNENQENVTPEPQAPEQAPPQPEAAASSEVSKDAKTMGMLCHLLALAGYVVPFGNIIGPLVIWLIKKDELEFVNDQGKEALNFQITVSIAGIVFFLLVFIVIGGFLLMALGIFNLVMIIIASVKANNGEKYRYPVCIRLIK